MPCLVQLKKEKKPAAIQINFFEDSSLVELMYPVFIACQVELSLATQVTVVVGLFKV